MVTKKSKTKQQLILEIEELRKSLDVMERRMQAGAGELRRCAEARLKEKKDGQAGEIATPLSALNTQQVVQELQIHQIELKMQNEELCTAQAELEASRARYFDLYDLAPVGYCTVSEKGMILEANLTAASMLGLDRSAVVMQPISRFIFKEDQSIYYLKRKQLFETGEPQACELRMMKKDGTIFWGQLVAIGAQDANGEHVCRVALSVITERKLVEKALQERVRELSCLYSISALRELPGITLDEVLKRIIVLIPPAWQFPEITAARIVIDGQRFKTQNFRKTSWMQTREIIVNGKPVGQVEVCYLEQRPASKEGPFLIEERHLLNAIAERIGRIVERMKLEDALRESEEFARCVIESSKDCIKVLDLEGRLLSMSAGGQKLLEIDDIAPYLNTSWIDFWKGKDREDALEAISKAKKGNTGIFSGYSETAKGTPKWWHITVSPINNPHGNCDRLLAFSRDITDRKRFDEVQAFLAKTSAGSQDEKFLSVLARYLANSLGMDFVCIDRLEGDGLTARTMAVWCDGKFEDNVAYALKDTPCGELAGKSVCCFPANVSQLFPKDQVLQDLRAESYVGVTLFDHSGKPIGLIAVIGRSPLKNRPLAEAMLKMVAVRAVSELERLDAEEALQKANDELEHRVEKRTTELRATIEKLELEVKERRRVEKSLDKALSEIKILKDQLETENIFLRQEIKMKHQFGNIIGKSDGLKYVLYRAEQVAPTNTTVLILGETGTGKELIAGAIHNMSPRKDRPMITVNCAALPANLMESELFGREKGAFTGADTLQIGRFEVANGSTLCLDEIGELPLEMQAKLLRAIQHSEFERLGSSRTIKVDVRIIATTNRNLEEMVRKGWFRQDLYYRLNVFSITVPPLRQRQADIPLLVQNFIERYARKLGKQITSINRETMKVLENYPWPGNVRELESVIEKAAILSPGPVLHLTDKLEIVTPSSASSAKTLEETERNQIIKILSDTRWRIEGNNGAAEILGLHPSTLRARMHKLGIHRPGT
ncbi:MAG: sigma 54-interacting transcriptional regulator [Proteobacteria bacterium]|nr:sigma 54-interacting transcriptional regulator [Pseudomonadota bacterium]